MGLNLAWRSPRQISYSRDSHGIFQGSWTAISSVNYNCQKSGILFSRYFLDFSLLPFLFFFLQFFLFFLLISFQFVCIPFPFLERIISHGLVAGFAAANWLSASVYHKSEFC